MNSTVQKLTRAAVTAALYTAICFFLKPLSYGMIQLRISEVLCILPIFFPEATWGLFIGCILSNLLGGAGVVLIDMVLGSLTTLVAAHLTKHIYSKTQNLALALFPPVILNALIVGSYVPLIYSQPGTVASLPLILTSILSVGIGQSIVIYALGYPFAKALKKTNIFKK